jgi:peptidoglycan/LPS O-acetylase OafA/YrhL
MSKVYFKNLDALRFFAFLSVFLYHSFWTNVPAVQANGIYQFFYSATRIGHLGVNFFFVLSGFLISFLLMDEEKLTRTISVKSFYIRRILRIWPLYYLIIIGLIVLFPVVYYLVKHSNFDQNLTPWKYFFFLSNFDYIQQGATIPTLNTMWSISIEEQFYLAWPLLCFLFRGKKFIYPILFIIAGTFLFRFFHADNARVLQWHTFSVINDMAVGGLLAYGCFYHKDKVQKLGRLIPSWCVLAVYVLFFMFAYFAEGSFSNLFFIASIRVILSLFFAFIIFEQVYAEHSIFKLGKAAVLTSLGKITYGLYCYHYLLIFAALKAGQLIGWNTSVFGVLVLDNLVALSLSILVAHLSYKYYEKRFLKLKPVHATKKAPVNTVPAP